MIARFFRSFFWAILLGFAITWFYLGMVSASTREAILIEDQYEGLAAKVVQPGDWSFVAARIVPDRVTLHRVFLGPRVLKLKYKHGLSQSEMLGLDDTYYIQSDVRIEYKLNAHQLANLFLELDRPDFRRLNAYLQFRMKLVVDRYVKSIYERDADIPNLEDQIHAWFTDGKAIHLLNAELGNYGVQVQRTTPLRVYVPDRNRYQAMLNLGERVLLELKLDRIRKINEARIRHDTSGIESDAYFARLEKMGRMLRRYPHLKEYAALELMGDRVQVMIVPSDKWLGNNTNKQIGNSIRGMLQDTGRPRTPARQTDKGDQTRLQPTETYRPRVAVRANRQFRDLTPP